MLAVDDIPCAIMVTDTQGLVKRINAEFLQLVGGSEYRLQGQSMEVLLTPAARIFCQTHVFPMLHHGQEVREVYLHVIASDGQPVPVMVNATSKDVDANPRVVWSVFVARERSRFEAELIKARAEAESLASRLAASIAQVERLNSELSAHAQHVELRNRQLSALSLTDALTGLKNRRALELEAEDWQSKNAARGRLALLMVDVDHFKLINDRCGHPEGDRVLIELARRLLSSARASDLVVRFGGEEFVLWLPETDEITAQRVSTRLHDSVKTLKTELGLLTISIGLVTWNGPAVPGLMNLLLRKADEALYEAKRQGRNRTVTAAPPSHEFDDLAS